MRFWDTSAVFPLIVPEPATRMVRALLASDPRVVVWWSTAVEAVSGLTRSVRSGVLSHEAASQAERLLDGLLDTALVVDPTDVVAARARRLLHAHDLRAADALQLAAGLVVTREQPAGVEFVAMDRRLRRAAAREGFDVAPRSIDPP